MISKWHQMKFKKFLIICKEKFPCDTILLYSTICCFQRTQTIFYSVSSGLCSKYDITPNKQKVISALLMWLKWNPVYLSRHPYFVCVMRLTSVWYESNTKVFYVVLHWKAFACFRSCIIRRNWGSYTRNIKYRYIKVKNCMQCR